MAHFGRIFLWVLGEHTTFVVFAVLAICAEAWLVFLALFDPGLRYRTVSPASRPLDSQRFRTMLEAITDAKLHCGTRFEVLTNGENFYESMLAALRQRRPVFERAHEVLGWILERQQ